MNKKLEEKLAMLAFGDMSPEETARLEREVAGNHEAMRVLDDYRGMRTGLKAIGVIPEHQLSTERLRHAVLNRGLQPKARPQIGWLWMPTMAAVLAFGVFFFRSPQQTPLPGSGVAINPRVDTGNQDLNRAENAFALATASGEIMSVSQPTPHMTLAVNPTPRRFRHQADSRIDALKAQVLEDFDNQMLTMGSGQAMALAARREPTSSSEAPIVLIDGTKDAKTGAQKATEVDSASNVVVGG